MTDVTSRREATQEQSTSSTTRPSTYDRRGPRTSGAPPESWVRRFGRYALLAAVIVLSAELAARVDDWIRLGVPFTHTPNEVADLRVVDSLGWHGRPFGRYHAWLLNNYGFRGPDMAPRPAAGCTRILMLGASETMGLYERPGKEFPAQLRDSLKSLGCFEVVNAGIPGMTIKSIVSFWNLYADRFGAQIVMVYPSPAFYLGIDVAGWPPPSRGKPQGTVPPVSWQPRLIDRLHQTLHTPDFLQRLRLERWIAQDTRGKPPEWFFTRPPPDRVDTFMRDLDSLVADIRAKGARPILVTHAVRATVPPRPEDSLLLLGWRHFTPRATIETSLLFEDVVAERMREYGSRTGVLVVDAHSALTGHGELFGDVVHFTDDGSARMAGVITRGLVSSGVVGAAQSTTAEGAHP